MSEETKTEKTIVEKIGFWKKAWKSIVTGVVCAIAGAGITFGVDQAQLQDTISKAEARQAAIAAAQYSAEIVIEKISLISTSENKAQAVKDAVDAAKAAIPDMIEAAQATKETAADAKADIQNGVEEAKKAIDEANGKTVNPTPTPAPEPAVTTPATK